jgi:hypothetical protein
VTDLLASVRNPLPWGGGGGKRIPFQGDSLTTYWARGSSTWSAHRLPGRLANSALPKVVVLDYNDLFDEPGGDWMVSAACGKIFSSSNGKRNCRGAAAFVLYPREVEVQTGQPVNHAAAPRFLE